MTVQEILYDSRALIDEYNEDGVVKPSSDSDIAALESNGIRFINMAVQEIFRDSKNFSEYNLVCKAIPNLLSDQFDVEEFTGTDLNYPEDGIVGAKAYYFTVDSDATVYIEEYNGSAWVVLSTISIVTDLEADYSGSITPSDSLYPIRIRMSGTTYYRHLNRCLYEYNFKTIPEYREWVRYDMPSDFGEVDKIINERPYELNSNFKWEGNNTLAVKQDYEGTIKIIYKPLPTTITAVTDVLDIYNPTAEQFVRFFVAAKMATTENTDLVNYFEGKANELKYEALKTPPASEEPIADVYGGDFCGNIYS